MVPDKQQVSEELGRLLASPSFRARKLIKRFLQYSVQETLAGRGDQLSQYTIAIHALGKPKDFSPVFNPVVRIEAGRLRKLLEDYYAAPPPGSTMSISIPRGGYQVEISPLPEPVPSCIIDDNYPSRVSEGPRLFAHFQIADELAEHHPPLLYKLRGDLLLVLSRFRNIRLVSSATLEPRQMPTRQFLLHLQQTYRADYLLTCDMNTDKQGNLILHYTLVHTISDEIIWADQFVLPVQPSQEALNDLYRWLVANAVSLHSGAILRHWCEYQLAHPPLPVSQQVLIHYVAFLRDTSRYSFATVLESCHQRLKNFPDDSKALVILARLCGYDHVLQYNLITYLETEWTRAARMALKLDPGNAEAHSAFAHNCYFRDDYPLSLAELETARQANPFDTACEYLYGLGLCLMGEWDQGINLIQQILAIPFNQPSWYYVLPFLHAFRQQDYSQALLLAERIQDFGYWGELARATSLYKLGRTERAISELQQMLHCNPAILKEDTRTDQRKLSSHQSLAAVWATLAELRAHLAAKPA